MIPLCRCTFDRLLTEEETGRTRRLLMENGEPAMDAGQIAHIDVRGDRNHCPYHHGIAGESGYCSCSALLDDWSAELGEMAGLKNGAVL